MNLLVTMNVLRAHFRMEIHAFLAIHLVVTAKKVQNIAQAVEKASIYLTMCATKVNVLLGAVKWKERMNASHAKGIAPNVKITLMNAHHALVGILFILANVMIRAFQDFINPKINA